MPGRRRVLLLLALAAALASGCSRVPASCEPTDKACLAELAKHHKAKQIAFWRSAIGKPIVERIGPVPPEFIDYMRIDNLRQGIPDKPEAAQVSPEFLHDVYQALDEMPDALKHHLGQRLIGIYFAKNMGGTGYTELVYDDNMKPVAGVVVLDADVLAARTANEWAEWKESSPFKPQAGYGLHMQIEAAEQNTRKDAIQYILLHEFGHVVSIGQQLVPLWDMPANEADRGHYSFYELSWIARRAARDGESAYVSLFDANFPQRDKLVFYFGPKLNASDMAATYEGLERTNFATLYSATNPFDDFAEALANYVHVVSMNKPYRITIYNDGKAVKTYESCWAHPRCAAKRRMLEQFLKRDGA
jgi:hypothetical protein